MSRLIAQCARQGHPYTLITLSLGSKPISVLAMYLFSLLMDYMEIDIWIS